MEREGTREFIRVLCLLEKHTERKVARAIEMALRLQHCNYDVVAHYLHAREAAPSPTFALDGREHLKGVHVQQPDLRAYSQLMGGLH